MVPLQDATNNSTIYRDLKEGLSGLPDDGRIILNYTGGTKAMAIHTYNWLQQERTGKNEVLFQYLDARKHKIITDCGRIRETGDLRSDHHVCMGSITTMLKLHGYQRLEKVTIDPYPDITEMIAKVMENEQINTFLKMTDLLRKIYYNDKGVCDRKNSLIERLKDASVQKCKIELEELIKSNPFLRDILLSFPSDVRILNEDGSLWTPSDSDTNKTVERRIRGCIHGFLDGKWLEFHVMRAIAGIVAGEDLTIDEHFGSSLEAVKVVGSKKFELDLFVLRGYQLSGISVTTAGESKAKSKAMEVMHRVWQIGGDEARGILVANLPNDKVTRDMEDDINFLLTGSTSGHFKVIGQEDWELKRLKSKLEDIIWS